jgi:hypothetical protein
METTKKPVLYGSLGKAVRDRIAEVFGPSAAIVDACDDDRECHLILAVRTPYDAQTSQSVGLWIKVGEVGDTHLCRSNISVGVLEGGVTPALSTETDPKIRPFLRVPDVTVYQGGEIAFSSGTVTSVTLDFARDVRELAERLLELAEPVEVDSERAYFSAAE